MAKDIQPVEITNIKPVPTSSLGSDIKAAGRKTDADHTDRTITTSGFNLVSIINDGPAELRIGIDIDSTLGVNIIYIKDGEEFAEAISGTVLHYSIINDSCSFRYLLR